MKQAIRTVVLLASSLLAACAKDPPEVIMVSPAPPMPSIAGECTSADSPWAELPDSDVRRNEAARNYRLNKDRYRALLAKRRVCRASLEAQFPTPRASKE